MNLYLFSGYLVIWTILSLYLLYLVRKQKKVDEKLQSFVKTIQRQDDIKS